MKLLIVLIFILSSCSQIKSQREFASIDVNNESFQKCPHSIKHESCKVLSFSTSLLSDRTDQNFFNFPLPKLETPFFEVVPYLIKLKSEDISCALNGDIEKISSRLFKINSSEVNQRQSLRCVKNSSNSELAFEYIIPQFSPFPLSEAEWMKGFYPDIVNNTEIKLAQIFEKWNLAKSRRGALFKPLDGVTYRARELLLKYSNQSEFITIDPSVHKFQFQKTLVEGDIIVVKNLKGNIEHEKYGTTDYNGFLTEQFLEENKAGKGYFIQRGIKPYEFFCSFKGEFYRFTNQLSHRFDRAGTVFCTVNTKKNTIFRKEQVLGSIEFTLEKMELASSIANIPSQIRNPKTRIENKIYSMNKSNKKNFNKWIKRIIDEKSAVNSYELELDKVYPYSMQVDGIAHTREKFKICGSVRPQDNHNLLKGSSILLTHSKMSYGEKQKIIELPEPMQLNISRVFTGVNKQCFSITAQMYIEKQFLNAVLFYEVKNE